ncbi:MAG TPA: hypothetical protein PLE81_12850 [Brevundimonas sp.]|uniref:hypothetical protein n=1 Tax=Brevundimonas sp. TaxID=1871086 RepID=UPI002D0B1873|nr:hypothetical protein [Brevundimonas sp.]HRH21511.1 hypothetical protein [Brevundimonas sp.]
MAAALMAGLLALVDGAWTRQWRIVVVGAAEAARRRAAWRAKLAITPRQARLALLQVGLLDDVEAAINGISDELLRRQAQISWEYADEIRRLDPWIAVFGAALNLDDAALDELFALEQAL